VGDTQKVLPVDSKGWEGVDQVHLAQDRDRWRRALANA
jgi:hypothetical protein